jgi:pyruvate formate lyase activating enzyme
VPATSLKDQLARLTREGELYERLPEGRIRCVACGHRCLIPPGREGICRVRFNDDGVLRVPFGYVGALQLDPVEKKPFFHALPGSTALSFGMLGCDYHCGYCFTGDTTVVTERGPASFADLFASGGKVHSEPDAEMVFPEDRQVVTGSGSLRRLKGVVRHRYRGEMVRIEPYYLPPLNCTPDHRVYATTGREGLPHPVPAGEMTREHYLAIPRRFFAGAEQSLSVASVLASHFVTYRKPWRLAQEDRELIAVSSAAGTTSRAIGLVLGKSSSYVRHVRSKIARGLVTETRTGGVIVEQGQVRFPGEHRPGIPAVIPVDVQLAALLGYYCAEGCVVTSKKRPNSHVVSFAFSLQEGHLARRVKDLVRECLGASAQIVQRETTLGVTAAKSSAALLLKFLAGSRSTKKRVPAVVAQAPLEVVRAFLDAYVEGDGHRYPNGKVTATTVSRTLAEGVAWLALRCGHPPSLYTKQLDPQEHIQGRQVKQAPAQHTVVWYEGAEVRRRLASAPDHYLVPLRGVRRESYDGDVYNMEVEEEHSYLAGFFAVSNCQNWLTSQALRDDRAVVPPDAVSPAELVRLALSQGAPIVTSTYNEPLITSEWAVAVFKEAKAAGLVCSYVSNGNGTPEVLDYIRPYVSLYKVDLKSFRDRAYRELGGTLDRVLWTIRALHEQGFWLEIVTLVVPGMNDSDAELTDIARFLASVSPDIPWHVTAFHPDYKMQDPPRTSVDALLRAVEIGDQAGLRFVYAGNLPGHVKNRENTYCPGCRSLLVERFGFRVQRNRLAQGHCPDCSRAIPGFWSLPGS